MKQIYANVTEETYNALFERARKENRPISEVIQIILAEATNTKCLIFRENKEQKK
jgi:hypothetical protein